MCLKINFISLKIHFAIFFVVVSAKVHPVDNFLHSIPGDRIVLSEVSEMNANKSLWLLVQEQQLCPASRGSLSHA